MKKSKSDQDFELDICRSVLSEMTDERLLQAKRFLDKLSNFKKLTKLHNTYITGVRTALGNTKNSKIYVLYNLDGTVTGRLSNSGANFKSGKSQDSKLGVSLHTLPREREELEINIRDYVVAPPGWDFITIDEKGMELRVLADVANEKRMIEAFHSGIDLHTYSASMVYNKKPELVSKEERQIAKEVSFLTVYGGTAFTLANKRNISEDKAQKIISSWMSAFPGVPAYMDYIREYINEYKYAKTMFGRRRNLLNIDSPIKSIREASFRQGLNFTIQSAANDILLCGLLGLSNKMKKYRMKGRIVGSVHDSISIVCPKSETTEVVKLAYIEMVKCPYMEEHFGIVLKVALDIDVKIGKSFGATDTYNIDHLK